MPSDTVTETTSQATKNVLESLDVNHISEVTNEQFVGLANQLLAIPDMAILFLSMALIFLVVGLIVVKKDRSKYMTIWFASTILSLVVLLVLSFLPNSIFSALQAVKGALAQSLGQAVTTP